MSRVARGNFGFGWSAATAYGFLRECDGVPVMGGTQGCERRIRDRLQLWEL